MLLPVINILKKKLLDPVFILVSRVHNLSRKESFFFVQYHAQMATFSKWGGGGWGWGGCSVWGFSRHSKNVSFIWRRHHYR